MKSSETRFRQLFFDKDAVRHSPQNPINPIMQWLHNLGVRDIALAPAGRNAGFVGACLGLHPRFQLTWFYEEACAAFWALGRIKRTGRPAAVITTSGSAAGQLLPAVMEAYFSGLLLVCLTADRPKSFRGTGAPQSTFQKDLFKNYTQISFDCDSLQDFNHQLKQKLKKRTLKSYVPIHINCCIKEPMDEPIEENPGIDIQETTLFTLANWAPSLSWNQSRQINAFFSAQEPYFILIGPTSLADRLFIPGILGQLQAPFYAELASGMRNYKDSHISQLAITNLDFFLLQVKKATGLKNCRVIRLGGVPTHRFWRDLEARSETVGLPVLNITALPFSGLSQKRKNTFSCALPFEPSPRRPIQFKGLLPLKNQTNAAFALFLQEVESIFPYSEQAWVLRLAKLMAPKSLFYLGNSLAIRWADLMIHSLNPTIDVYVSRGVNGIDGQVSTFLGLASADHAENWAILGDLTVLYDLAGFWPSKLTQESRSLRLVILNNGGGKIFQGMYQSEHFQNTHALQFSHLAAFWGWDIMTLKTLDDLKPLPKRVMIEIIPDPQETLLAKICFNKHLSKQKEVPC